MILVPANIDRLGHDLYPSVKVSQTRSLVCPVFGIPTPEVIWYKDGDLLSPNTNQYISTHDDGRRLEVTATSVADSGVYQCRVHNDAGEDQLTYHLKVIGWLPMTSSWILLLVALIELIRSFVCVRCI